MIVVCPKCGANNRVPDSLETGEGYFCGKCKTRLSYVTRTANAMGANSHATKTAADKRKETVTIFMKSFLGNVAFHPLLLAMVFILQFYSGNVVEVSPSEIAMPIAISLGFTSLIFLLSWLILRDIRKTGLILSAFLVLFFYFGILLKIVRGWAEVGTPRPLIWLILAIIGITVFIAFAFFIVRTRRDLYKPTFILNAVSAFLLLIPAANIVVHETSVAQKDSQVSSTIGLGTPSVPGDEIMPDVYYIVLDRYASTNTLKEVFDFDNIEFMSYLYQKGFYVASESRCNYVKTDESLASSLNMEYLDDLSKKLGKEFDDFGPIYKKLQDYSVWRFLNSKGYEFIHIGSWWGPTMENIYADKNLNYTKMPYFSRFLFENTLAYHLCIKANVIEDRHTVHRNCILYAFNKLAEIPNIEAPTFVFAHVLATHPPYVFNADGSYLTAIEASKRTEQVNYIAQLQFINKEVEGLIDTILSKSVVPPIIILQADEGPFPAGTDFRDFKWQDASQAQLQEKMRILNAYYLPNIDSANLYLSITPVNSFRVIFNLYFATDLELLPDKSYAYAARNPYEFFDVTDRVMYQSEGSITRSTNE